jgi:hypothetical protein
MLTLSKVLLILFTPSSISKLKSFHKMQVGVIFFMEKTDEEGIF